MSRTIRRPHKHLLRWWLPELQAVALTQSKEDWRQKRLPGLHYSQQEPVIVRRVQSDIHRFFAGPGKYSRRVYQRKFKQCWKVEMHHVLQSGEWDAYMDPELYYPYML
jgi:hypothetical protein